MIIIYKLKTGELYYYDTSLHQIFISSKRNLNNIKYISASNNVYQYDNSAVMKIPMHLRVIVRSMVLVNTNEFSKQISAEWDIYL